MSVSVAAATRPANVEALSSWSACSVSATSKARIAVAFGRSPVSMYRKFAAWPMTGIGLDDAAAGLEPAPRRDNGPHLRGEPDRLPVLRRRRRVVHLRVVVPERRRQGAQRIHAVHRRQRPHQPENRFGQRPRRGQLRLQVAELRARRQPPVPEQVADLFEGGGFREIVDVVAAVREDTAIAVEITDRGRGRDDVLEPALGLLRGCHLHRLS